jgi:hypothetical protein
VTPPGRAGATCGVSPARPLASRLLPLLLALPGGAVAGVPVVREEPGSPSRGNLGAFGPWVRTEGELRHAARRPPARLILDVPPLPLPMVEASLPAWSGAGVVVVASSDDVGCLSRWCDRLLVDGPSGPAWQATDRVRARRLLEVCLVGPPGGRRVRVPLSAHEAPEAVLAAIRADGLLVRESRIVYAGPSPR